MRVLVLPGDGIGPEKFAATVAVPAADPPPPPRAARRFQAALHRPAVGPQGRSAGLGTALRARASRQTAAAALG